MSTRQRPAIYPVECPCGWVGANRRYPSEARKSLTNHRAGSACKDNPDYVTEKERVAKRTAAARAAQALLREAANQPECTIATGSCGCIGCYHAEADGDSPLNLTDGRWVVRRGTRVWRAA